MKKSDTISNTLAFYSFLLSGAMFSGFLNYGKNTLLSYFFACICFAAVALPVFLFKKANPDFSAHKKYEPFFIIPLFICGIGLFSVYSKSFCEALPSLSDGFSQKWFSVVFVIVSLLTASIVTGKQHSVFTSICILLLPALVLPMVLGWFNFLGYKMPDISIFSQTFDMDKQYVLKGLSLGAQMPLMSLLPDIKKQKNTCRCLFFAIALFFITLFLESAKHVLYFGTLGAMLITNPIKTMLSSMPYLDIMEIYVFAFYFAYMIKITLLFSVAFVLLKRLFEVFGAKKVSEKKFSFLVFVLFSASFIGFQLFPDNKIPGFISDVLFGTISAVLIVLGIIVNYVSKRKKTRQKPL